MMPAPARKTLAQQPDQIIALDEAAAAVKEEAAVEIPVPGQPKVRLALDHGPGRQLPVFGQERIGHAGREIAVGFVQNLVKFEGELRFQQIDDGSSSAIARIDHDGQGAQRLAVHIGQEVVDIP